MLAKLFTCSCWWENVEQQFYRGLTDWKYSLKANQYPERRWSTWARRSYYKATVALLTNPIVPWLICWEWRCDKCLKEHWDTAAEDCQAIWLVFCCFFFFHSTKFRSRQVTALEVGRSCSYTHSCSNWECWFVHVVGWHYKVCLAQKYRSCFASFPEKFF